MIPEKAIIDAIRKEMRELRIELQETIVGQVADLAATLIEIGEAMTQTAAAAATPATAEAAKYRSPVCLNCASIGGDTMARPKSSFCSARCTQDWAEKDSKLYAYCYKEKGWDGSASCWVGPNGIVPKEHERCYHLNAERHSRVDEFVQGGKS